MSKQVNYNENLCAGAAIRDDKGRRISKLFEASHPKMTVGYAKNLIMPDDPTEQEFNFRQSGGGVIEDGVAVIDKVKGNSVVWNQLVEVKTTFTTNGVHFEKNGNFIKVYTDADGATNDASISDMLSNKSWSEVAIVGHKYAMSGCPNGGSKDSFYMSCYSSNSWQGEKFDTGNGIVFSVTENVSNGYPRIVVAKDAIITTPIYFRPQLIDLTQMFGAGNEPTTYEEFLSRKPKVADEYAYNEGTIVNNKVEAIKTSGVNLWDEQWELGSLNAQGLPAETTASIRSKEFNRCLPNCEICFSCQSAAAKLIYWYDVNKAFISRYEIPNSTSIYGVTTSPANAYFFKVRNDKSTYNHDLCINISDPAINGKYFPYEKHELDLSWVKDIKDAEGVKLFEDGMKSVGTAFDEVGKNKAVKRFGVKVFDGTESFTDYLVNYGSFAIMRDAFVGVGSSIGISNRYVVSRLWESDPDRTKYDKQIYIDSINNRVWIRDSAFADVDSLKQYLAELYAAGTPLVLYYELAEPIEVEYDEKSLTYPVVAGGTEEAIASEPSSAFRADIGYGIDAVKTILDLKARVEALEAK